MTGQVPEQRDNEQDSLVSYRLAKVEEGLVNISHKLDEFLASAQVKLIDHRIKNLETSRNKMIGALSAIALIVIGKLFDDVFGVAK
ncbi:MAG TPA: hypothetical protein VFK94_00560 [Patescibacteria group bacterium]|nr:hypothetical protein [Patescibacteria group bacterium]